MKSPSQIRLAALLSFLLLVVSYAPGPIVASAFTQEPPKKKQQEVEVPVPLPKGKKLVLKDGSYHIVRSYDVKPDPANPSGAGRVRFFSIERSAWEELPADLVDWEATRKAEVEAARQREETLEKMRAIEAREKAEAIDVDASIEVAPGLFLPDAAGMYAVEGRTILPLALVGTEASLDKKRVLAQIFVPIVSPRHKIQIAGKRAPVRLTTGQPEFYIRTPDDREPNIELIQAKVKSNAREIELVTTYLTGDKVAQRKSMSVQRWPVARGVYRLTMSQTLDPGEYVLAEVLAGEEAVNAYVWDFGIDRPAPKPAKK